MPPVMKHDGAFNLETYDKTTCKELQKHEIFPDVSESPSSAVEHQLFAFLSLKHFLMSSVSA